MIYLADRRKYEASQPQPWVSYGFMALLIWQIIDMKSNGLEMKWFWLAFAVFSAVLEILTVRSLRRVHSVQMVEHLRYRFYVVAVTLALAIAVFVRAVLAICFRR